MDTYELPHLSTRFLGFVFCVLLKASVKGLGAVLVRGVVKRISAEIMVRAFNEFRI